MIETRIPHEVTDACRPHHCFDHNVDEPVPPGGAYLICGECFHCYPTARSLRRAYRREVIWMSYRLDQQRPLAPAVRDLLPGWQPATLRRTLWRMITLRARNIYFCPECAHDF